MQPLPDDGRPDGTTIEPPLVSIPIQNANSQNGSNVRTFVLHLGPAMDTFAPLQRSEIMRRVRSSGTRPELIVRSMVRRMGVRYRSCPGNLPGKPDLVILTQDCPRIFRPLASSLAGT